MTMNAVIRIPHVGDYIDLSNRSADGHYKGIYAEIIRIEEAYGYIAVRVAWGQSYNTIIALPIDAIIETVRAWDVPWPSSMFSTRMYLDRWRDQYEDLYSVEIGDWVPESRLNCEYSKVLVPGTSANTFIEFQRAKRIIHDPVTGEGVHYNIVWRRVA